VSDHAKPTVEELTAEAEKYEAGLATTYPSVLISQLAAALGEAHREARGYRQDFKNQIEDTNKEFRRLLNVEAELSATKQLLELAEAALEAGEFLATMTVNDFGSKLSRSAAIKQFEEKFKIWRAARDGKGDGDE
jgi:hypothetical protein